MPEAEKAPKLAAVMVASPEAPKLFGQAPEVHLRKMLTDLGVTAIVSADEAVPEEATAVVYWNGGAVCSKRRSEPDKVLQKPKEVISTYLPKSYHVCEGFSAQKTRMTERTVFALVVRATPVESDTTNTQ
jgi:hypothetical protein